MQARYPFCALTVALAMVLASVAPARAKANDIFYSKKLYSALALGASLYFLKSSYDARQDANDSYDLYKSAGTGQRARELYDESRRNDTKSAILLGLGLGTLVYSVHLFLSDRKEGRPPSQMRNGLVEMKGVALDVQSNPLTGGVRLNLKKGF